MKKIQVNLIFAKEVYHTHLCTHTKNFGELKLYDSAITIILLIKLKGKFQFAIIVTGECTLVVQPSRTLL